MQIVITTKYKTHPNSNSGDYQARSAQLKGIRTVRCDQALSDDANHRRAAEKFATDFDLSIVGDMEHLDDGGRKFQAVTS